MMITRYHGRCAGFAIYIVINIMMPLVLNFFVNFDISTRFYIAVCLFFVMTALNIFRMRAGGYLRAIYGMTIFLNVLSFILFGMLSYISAIPFILYLL